MCALWVLSTSRAQFLEFKRFKDNLTDEYLSIVLFIYNIYDYTKSHSVEVQEYKLISGLASINWNLIHPRKPKRKKCMISSAQLDVSVTTRNSKSVGLARQNFEF